MSSYDQLDVSARGKLRLRGQNESELTKNYRKGGKSEVERI